jgi:hypothetical protein
MLPRHPSDLISEEELDLVRTYQLCDRGMTGVQWPDGRGLLDQPMRLVQAFAVIGAALAAARKPS